MANHFQNLVGVSAAQMPGTEKVFLEIIKDFDLIIELGTDNGGLSMWIYHNKKAGAVFFTYELEPSHIQIPKEHEINKCIKYCDCLTPDVIVSIAALIKTGGKTLFLCDGGSKVIEFGIYSKLIKSGDVIMLHDFADSPDEVNNYKEIKAKCLLDGSWDGNGFEVHESSLEDIRKGIDDAGLKKYKYIKFLNILWGSFIKS
jgi:hypothetical protein